MQHEALENLTASRTGPTNAPGADASSPVRLSPQAALILPLQRTIGNHAVIRLLAAYRESRSELQSTLEKRRSSDQVLRLPSSKLAIEHSLQRFGTGEHVATGEIHGKQEETQVNGVKLIYGELISLGDFFETPDDIYKEPKDKLEALLAAIRRDAINPGVVSNDEWEKLTDGRYLKLASKNAAHFSPAKSPALAANPSALINNKTAYEIYHAQALAEAKAGNRDRSMVTNGFADHFLTDAFAAGHLVNKTDIMGQFNTSFASNKDKLLDAVAKKAWDSMEVRSAFSPYTFSTLARLYFGEPAVHSAHTLSGILSKAVDKEPDLISNAAVKAVHDKLNTEGVNVSNAVGSWKTVGDGELKSSPKTLEMARLAVEASQAELRAAAAGKVATSPFNDVWKYVPIPTTAGQDPGQQTLDRETAVYTNATSPAIIDAMSDLVIQYVDTLISRMVNDGDLVRTEAGFAPYKPEDYAYPSLPW